MTTETIRNGGSELKPCEYCRNGFFDGRYGQDVECVNGILIDVDVYSEGWARDEVYPVAPCHPGWKKQCSDQDWSADITDIHARLDGRAEDCPTDALAAQEAGE